MTYIACVLITSKQYDYSRIWCLYLIIILLGTSASNLGPAGSKPNLETQNISYEHILHEDSILNMCWIRQCICKYNLSACDCLGWIYFQRSFWSDLEAYTSDSLRYMLASYVYAWSTFDNISFTGLMPTTSLLFPVLACIAHGIFSCHLGVSISTKHLFSSSKHALCDPHYQLSLHQETQIFLIGT